MNDRVPGIPGFKGQIKSLGDLFIVRVEERDLEVLGERVLGLAGIEQHLPQLQPGLRGQHALVQLDHAFEGRARSALTLLGGGDPIPLLTDVLTYHVVDGKFDLAAVSGLGNGAEIPAVGGVMRPGLMLTLEGAA